MTPLEEVKTISKIANRSIAEGNRRDKINIVMDLEFTHEECPLDLAGLLRANGGDFAHDICGIAENMNHETKQLDNCFVPRFAL